MFEFKLKYQIKEVPERIRDYPCVQKKNCVDTYYDLVDCPLLKTGSFFRVCDNKRIDFRMGKKTMSFSVTNYENEFENLLQVLKSNFGYELTPSTVLELLSSFQVLCTIVKEREVYQIEPLVMLTLDTVSESIVFLEIKRKIEQENLNAPDALNHKRYLEYLLVEEGILNDDAELFTDERECDFVLTEIEKCLNQSNN